MTPLPPDTTDNMNNCDGGDQKGLKPKSKCGEGCHVGRAFDYEGSGSHERIGCGGVQLVSVEFGRLGVGDGVRFICGIRRGVDDHKSIESKGGKAGAQLLVVGYDRNAPKG